MNETKHTPLPWQTNQDLIFRQQNLGGVKLSIAYMSRELPSATVKANTALIVRAVNTIDQITAQRDALLEACKQAEDTLKFGASWTDKDFVKDAFGDARKQLQAALALCEKEDK